MKQNWFLYPLLVILVASITFLGLSGSARGIMLSPGDFLTGTRPARLYHYGRYLL